MPLLVLTLTLGLTGALVLASLAGSRRGREALDHFVAFHDPGDLEAYVQPELPVDEQEALAAELARIGGPSFVQVSAVVVALPGPDGVTGEGTDVTVASAHLAPFTAEQIRRPLVLDGELPLPDGSVAVNERLADRRGLEVGDRLTMAVFDPASIDQVGGGDLSGPSDTFEVTLGAVIRTPFDLARSPFAQPGTVFEADEGRMILGPDLWAAHGADAASYGLAVAGSPDGDRDAVIASMEGLGENVLVNPTGPEDLAKLGPVRDAIELESNALLAFAALTLVFGLAVLGTALGPDHTGIRRRPPDAPVPRPQPAAGRCAPGPPGRGGRRGRDRPRRRRRRPALAPVPHRHRPRGRRRPGDLGRRGVPVLARAGALDPVRGAQRHQALAHARPGGPCRGAAPPGNDVAAAGLPLRPGRRCGQGSGYNRRAAGEEAMAQASRTTAPSTTAQDRARADRGAHPGAGRRQVPGQASGSASPQGRPATRPSGVTLLEAARRRAAGRDPTDELVQASLANTRGFWSMAGEQDTERLAVDEAALRAIGAQDGAERARLLAVLASELMFSDEAGRRQDASPTRQWPSPGAPVIAPRCSRCCS